jgi:hypothetical protein
MLLNTNAVRQQNQDLTHNMPKSAERAELNAAAQAIADLVPVRNDILHGKPCTGPNGEVRLSTARVLEIPDLEAAANALVGRLRKC